MATLATTAAALVTLSAGLTSASAAAITIGNSSFTSPSVASGTYYAATNTALTNNAWTFSGSSNPNSSTSYSDTGIAANGAVVATGSTALVGAPNGQAGFIEGGNSSGSASILQSIGTLAAGNYTVSAMTEAAGINGNTDLSTTWTNSIEVVLLNVGVVPNKYTTFGAFNPTSITSFNQNSVSGNLVAGNYYLELIGTIDAGGTVPTNEQDATTYLSGIQMGLTAAVPEPATLGMVAAGGLGLLLLSKRRRCL